MQKKRNWHHEIGIYVDNCPVLGKEKDINQLIEDLKLNFLSLKVESDLKEYLTCWVVEDVEKREILVLQPHLIKKLIDKFGNEISDKGMFGTLGIPRFNVTYP